MKIDYNLNGEGAKSVFFVICALVFFAFFEFYYKINAAYPSALPLGYILTIFAGIVFSRVKYEDFSPAFKICFRGLAVLIGLYAAFVFPDYPIVVDKYGGTEGAIVLGGWFLGVLCSLLTLWRPSFLLASGFYLWWSKQIAGTVTGFPYHTLLDILPAIEISAFMSTALFLLVLMGQPWVLLGNNRFVSDIRSFFTQRRRYLGDLIVFVAISMQLANYFTSGLGKASLNGGVLSWSLENNLADIFDVAVINGQLFWQDYPFAVSTFSAIFDYLKHPMSIGVLVFQLFAIIAFRSRNLLVFLFLVFDLMHFGIFVSVGANFGPWFILNLVILAAAARLDDRFFSVTAASASAALVIIFAFASPPFWSAWLRWYDTPAINTTYFVAEDVTGTQTRVPVTYFGFYSYPIAHMSFGLPPGQYLPVGTNGGVLDYKIMVKARTCAFTDADMVSSQHAERWSNSDIPEFIRHYHRQMVTKYGPGQSRNFNIYPHHFWTRPKISNAFRRLDKRKIVAYVMKTDSLCLRRSPTGVESRLVAHNEIRIDVR